MGQLQEIIQLISGIPQARVRESLSVEAPIYSIYGQSEMEVDLAGVFSVDGEAKKIKTEDNVSTVDEGDVLFSLISGTATLVRQRHSGYVFTQNYVKLVPSNAMIAQYLVYLLNADSAIKRQLQRSIQGTRVMKYTVKQLRELELPVLPAIGQQVLIGEIYFKQLRIHALQERIAKLETIIILEKLKGANHP